jgi:hypothetical protein
MADINDILNQFPEEIIENTFEAKIVGGNINWQNTPLLLQAEKIESNQILFSHHGQSLRVEVSKSTFKPNDQGSDITGKGLFWISHVNKDKVKLNFLHSGAIQAFTEPLEIGFDDNFIFTNKTFKIEKLPEQLRNDFVFQSPPSDYIFIQTYPNATERIFTLHGMNKRVDIVVEAKKWIVRKITNKPFTRKHEDFLVLTVAQYPSIRFVEASKAKEAYETIQAEEAKGNTLISLWKVYSQIELDRALQVKERFGEMSFTSLKSNLDGITRVRINNPSESLKSALRENKDDILNASLELMSEQEKSDSKPFKVKSVSDQYVLELYDDYGNLPNNGKLTVSLIGDTVVNSRRERALKSLGSDRKYITANLRFAIEGMADAMFTSKKRKEKPITERTRNFLKEKFGIDQLTVNQQEAVEMAINTPDIAVIQGPPGTGKSTVVAAICDRLIELAEKNKKDSVSKLILVSAFQNDTVEHIASKIYTFGLPTIKVGRSTQGNIRSEDRLIEEIKLRIDNSLQKITAQGTVHRISAKLCDIKAIYMAEQDEDRARESIDGLLQSANVSEELWTEWRRINDDKKFSDSSTNQHTSLLKGIRITKEAYDDDGYLKIQRLLKSDIPLTVDDRLFLEECPVDNPTEDILNRLDQIQASYLEQINHWVHTISSGTNTSILEWLEKAIRYLRLQEEASYQDEETFLFANLETLRNELDGQTEYIRNTIKEYGESLAATNQVAGSREMASYSAIDNVILEEAARSNPLDLLIPMTKATERIILIGDQDQLPHLLEDDIADETTERLSDRFLAADIRDKLQQSLFGVIFRNLSSSNPKRTITLTEQFRMHPFIGDFISRIYYKNELKSGLPQQSELKKHNLQLPWAKDKVAIFHNVPKSHGPEKGGKSKSRPAEALQIIEILDQLQKDPAFERLSIGIITFYSRQVEEIFKEAAKRGYATAKTDDTYDIALSFRETLDGREKLRIGSVDSFQGKEFDIVMLSTVRSNEIARNHENYRKVFGFLTLSNRLNVAFSRSQKLLIVVGDGAMFSDEFAKTYVEGLHEFYVNLSTDNSYGNRL